MAPERQLGLFWGVAAAILVVFSPWAETLASAAPACPFKLVAGIPCLTCGATRAAVALAAGNLIEAFSLNPLAALGWALFVAGGLVAGVLALRGRGVVEPVRQPSRAWRLAALSGAVANWIYVLRTLD